MKLTNWNYRRLAIVGAIAAMVVIGIAAVASRKPKVEYDTYQVKSGLLRQTVQVTGEVVSSADVDLKFETAGRVQSIAVKVGDVVKAGDVLASLSGSNERIGVQKAQAALLSAQASLDRTLKGATVEDIHVTEVAVANAETALEQARQSLADTTVSNAASSQKAYGDLDGQVESLYLKSASAMQTLKNDVFDAVGTLRPDILSSDSGTQNQALADYSAARTAIVSMDAGIALFRAASSPADWDRLSAGLLNEAKVVRQSVQSANALMQSAIPVGGTAQTAFDVRKTEVKAAWVDLNAVVSSTEAQKNTVGSTIASNAASLNAATQSVSTAQGALESAKASLSLKRAPATSYDIAAARASVTQAAAALGEANLAFDRTRIRAPFDGTIAQVISRVGSTATVNDVVLKLHGDNVYEIEADVPETDVAKIRTGLKAVITLDAYGDDVKFGGELTSIDTAQTVIQDVVYYKTRFRLAAEDRAVRTGMTASIEVVTQERADALVVPQRAIREDAETGGKYVRTLVNGVETRKDVVIGLRGDDGFVEILSGLSVGEEVILAIRENGQIKR